MTAITTVSAKSSVHHKKCYKIKFESGDDVVADYDHRWKVRESGNGKVKVLTTEEMFNSGRKYSIIRHNGVEGKDAELPIDPYVLGVWLGDGASRDGRITISNSKIFDEIKKRGFAISDKHYDTRGSKCETRTVYGLAGKLKDIGVINNKHIPLQYLLASDKQRKELLAGILDTDGHYHKKRHEVTLSTTQSWWEDGLTKLVCSLGGKITSCKYKTNGFGKSWDATGYRILTRFNPFIARDINFEITKTANTMRGLQYIASIEPTETVPTQCIKVSSEEHTYLFGRQYIMTHNTGDIYKKINIHKDLKDKGFKAELFTLYTLQLNFYRMLTGKKKMFIWALEGEHWTKVEVPKVDDDLMRELIVWK